MNVNICVALLQCCVADIVTSGAPMSQNTAFGRVSQHLEAYAQLGASQQQSQPLISTINQ